jgi:hypothetical protein
MCDTQAILAHARLLGLRLEREGDRIAIFPARLCPLALLDEIRRHKPQLLDSLEARAHALPPDCAPWLHVAKQVLAGEFDEADRSTIEAVSIGLRAVKYPSCQRALERLRIKGKP